MHVRVSIANLCRNHLQYNYRPASSQAVVGNEVVTTGLKVKFSAKIVEKVIMKMLKGKSPGHDGLSIVYAYLSYTGRPISLATTLAKVLDSLLNGDLKEYIELHDAKFGFKVLFCA